jgi:hypothetical protein
MKIIEKNLVMTALAKGECLNNLNDLCRKKFKLVGTQPLGSNDSFQILYPFGIEYSRGIL